LIKVRPFQRLLVGVTASIGVLDVHRYLQAILATGSDEVRVIMTPAAARMVNPHALATYARYPVLTDPYDLPGHHAVAHVELADWAQACIVLPATADILGKVACGIADNLLTTTLLMTPPPILFFPNMNLTMWENPAVQRNAELLRSYGHQVIDPTGLGFEVATGRPAKGAMPSPEEVINLLAKFSPQSVVNVS
jgi:phosphopantothenoylcysteine decarboxylase/phosphopantothenate--cysteine ligase